MVRATAAQEGPGGTFRQVVGSSRRAAFSSLVQTNVVCLVGGRPAGGLTIVGGSARPGGSVRLNVAEQPRLTEPLRAAAEWTGAAAVLPRWSRAGADRQTAARRGAVPLLMPAAGFLALAALIALGVHTPPSLLEGPAILAMVWLVPFAAAGLCLLAFYRPWHAYLAILALTPVWDAAQVSWQAGPIQVILQTVFMAALAVALLRRSLTRASWIEFPEAAAIRSSASERLVAISLIALLGLTVASTALSRDIANSTTSLLHGIVEPVAMGVFLVALKPTRRQLAWLVVALGISAGIGSFINSSV